jgi:predicted metal-dependent phosphoesterase TrpH
MKNTDLHIHTYYSDGCHSPKYIIDLAVNKKLKAIAITDHNNLLGSQEALSIKQNKLEIIPGIEINSSKTEILGYFIDVEDSKLNLVTKKIQESSKKYVCDKIKQLQDLNYDIEYEEVLEKANPKSTLMLSHVAMVIKDKQEIEFQDIFENIFSKTKKVRTGIKPYTPKEIINTIKKAGGVSVLPHPWFLDNFVFENIDGFLNKLISYGLSGIETTGFTPPGFEEKKELFKKKAKEYNLIECGGSDFHCLKYLKNNILGKYNIPYSAVQKLKKKII